jgi:hypothetical protein
METAGVAWVTGTVKYPATGTAVQCALPGDVLFDLVQKTVKMGTAKAVVAHWICLLLVPGNCPSSHGVKIRGQPIRYFGRSQASSGNAPFPRLRE